MELGIGKKKKKGGLQQGRYIVQNRAKYKGNVNNVRFLSSWERTAFRMMDANPDVIYWNSEETVIPYVSPKDGRIHRYYMDLTIWTRKPEGGLQVTLVEIKPLAQTKPPRKSKTAKGQQRYLRECATFAINSAKWDATEKLCKSKGWIFEKWTEEQLVVGKAAEKTSRQNANAYRKKARAKAKAAGMDKKSRIAAAREGLRKL